MTSEHYDAVVVGAGFAGVTCARELRHAGRSVVVLEGRDRLGGRTWYKDDALPGRTLEMGGTWVHWFQPHVWAEISRYGLEVIESLGTSAPSAWSRSPVVTAPSVPTKRRGTSSAP